MYGWPTTRVNIVCRETNEHSRGEANKITQLLVKFVINVVERTISKLYANLINQDPGRDQIGHAGPKLNEHIDAIFMKLNAVMTVSTMAQPWKTWQTRTRVYFIIAVCKDSYVVYACWFDWVEKWEWFAESMRINQNQSESL